MSLLLGDLNTCDNEVGYKMLRHQASLLDAFKEKQNFEKDEQDGSTCYAKSNIYGQTTKALKSAFPDGVRIDYILYGYKNGKGLILQKIDD